MILTFHGTFHLLEGLRPKAGCTEIDPVFLYRGRITNRRVHQLQIHRPFRVACSNAGMGGS
jgi:hypothetical protein